MMPVDTDVCVDKLIKIRIRSLRVWLLRYLIPSSDLDCSSDDVEVIVLCT